MGFVFFGGCGGSCFFVGCWCCLMVVAGLM